MKNNSEKIKDKFKEETFNNTINSSIRDLEFIQDFNTKELLKYKEKTKELIETIIDTYAIIKNKTR